MLSFLAVTSINARSLWKRDTVVPSSLPKGWVYAGCYFDDVGARSLSGGNTASQTTMTDESCISFCASNDFIYAGTEYSNECWCDSTLAAQIEPDADCNMPCSGNSTESCGGSGRLTVFKYNSTTPLGPAINQGVLGYGEVDCYVDSAGARTLGVGTQVDGGAANMTVANCVSACSSAGYSFAGVEYAQECCTRSLYFPSHDK